MPTCFNCQNKLVLDESVFELLEDDQNPFLTDVSVYLIYFIQFITILLLCWVYCFLKNFVSLEIWIR